MSPFVPHNIPVRLLLPVNPFYGWKNGVSEKCSDLPKSTMQATDGVGLITKLLPTISHHDSAMILLGLFFGVGVRWFSREPYRNSSPREGATNTSLDPTDLFKNRVWD